jgi:gamma-glutamylcyclotransferase (GGCT)/AIG2-like uncharacterized protein YtfP
MTTAKSDYLFVYSSLLRGFSTDEYDYVAKFFDFVGPAKTKGKLSILNNIVVGTPSTENVFLKGELYKIRVRDQFSFAIGQLDEYEGVHPEPPKEPLYRREMTTAILENHSEITAWVYWYNSNVDGLPVLPSGDVTEFQNKK